MAKRKDSTVYVFVAVFIMFLVLSFLIVRPFITAIFAGVVIALIFYPLYRKLHKKTKMRNLTALIVTVIALLLIFLPIVFLFQQIGFQAKVAYVLTRQRLMSGDIIGDEICLNSNALICDVNEYYKELSSDPQFIYQRDTVLGVFEKYLWESTPNIIMIVPKFFINLFIMTFVLFYTLRDGRGLFKRLEEMLPLKKRHKQKIIKKVSDVNYAILYGHVITGLVQGVVGLIGLYIFRVPSPLLLGLAMIIAALIPFVGAPLVWVPVALLKIFNGLASGDQVGFTQGLGLFLYGIFIISTIDNVIKPKIMGDRAHVNPVIILLGLLGGLALFGIIGIIVGPLVLALTTTLIEIYEAEKDEITG